LLEEMKVVKRLANAEKANKKKKWSYLNHLYIVLFKFLSFNIIHLKPTIYYGYVYLFILFKWFN
jgi:hypothetical protein